MKGKVLLIASYPESLINFRLHLMKEFLSRGYAVTVIAPHDEKVEKHLHGFGIKYIPIELERNGSNPFKDILLIKILYSHIKAEKPNIVFSYTIKPVIYGTLASKLAGVSNIYSMLTGTGYVFANTNLKNKIIGIIARSLFRFSLRFNKKLFFQNKDNVTSFIDAKLVAKTHPLTIINGSGVDINYFSTVPLPQNEISFLMIARLIYDKGIREYIAAARIIKNKYPNVKFRLAGWIDTNPNSITQNELSKWMEEGVVDYLGKLSDVRGSITQTSVYVLPSYGEGTPRTVLEAMSMGRPIITTDVPGCRETVKIGKNGFLVKVCDVESLCEAMEYFIQDPNEIEKMGKQSRIIAEDKYDVYKVNATMIKEMDIC